MKKSNAADKAGLSIKEWTRRAGIGYSTYFTIPEEFRPYRVKVGDRDIIREPAAEWLERMEKLGGVPKRTAAAPMPGPGGIPTSSAA